MNYKGGCIMYRIVYNGVYIGFGSACFVVGATIYLGCKLIK